MSAVVSAAVLVYIHHHLVLSRPLLLRCIGCIYHYCPSHCPSSGPSHYPTYPRYISLQVIIMSTVPGGPKSQIRRRANQERQSTAERPASTRSAGAGGSSNTLLKLYTDEAPGLSVDPVVVMVMALGFIFSVVALHVIAKLAGKFSA